MNICTNKNCQIGNNDAPMVCCWICQKPMHAKCAGFGGNVADSINNSGSGVTWSCDHCRVPLKDIYRFLNLTKNSISDMAKEFDSLYNKFKIREENFTNFKFSECDTLSSPKRKKTNTRALRSTTALAEKPSTSSNPQPPTITISNVTNIEKPTTSAPDSCIIDVGSPICPNNNNNNDPGPSSVLNINTNLPTLRSVPKRKSIFVSRLDPNTSEQDVANFINSKLKSKATFFVKKFNFNYERDVSSFKVTPPLGDFAKILDENFWPTDTLVHEFIERPRNRVKTVLLTNPSTPSSKN